MDHNSPFFPVAATYDKQGGLTASRTRGIQVRDAVALHCLQGMLANPEFAGLANADQDGREQTTTMAYEFADALIAAS